MNNVDVIILIIVGISALIALNRGLVKEVLSIIGWVLATVSIIYLLPVFEPVVEEYIVGGWMSSVVTAILILIVFMLIWFFATNGLIKDIRNSKLSTADRILGLFFGIARAFLLVVLFNIMIGWMMPEKRSLKRCKSQNTSNWPDPLPNRWKKCCRKKPWRISAKKRVPGEKRNKRPNRNLKPKRDRLKKRAAGPETMRKSFLTSWPARRLKNRLDARKTPLNRLLKIPMAITKTKGIISTA